MRSTTAFLAASVAVAGTACAPNNAGNTDLQCKAISSTPAARPAQWTGSVFTIVMENHDRERDPRQRGGAVHQRAREARRASPPAITTPYVHPSEPNYIWMVAGENFGILNDDDPTAAPHRLDVAPRRPDRARRPDLEVVPGEHGRAVRPDVAGPVRGEAQPVRLLQRRQRLGRQRRSTRRQRCTEHVVDYRSSTRTSRPHACPKYVFITPNLDNDMHDGIDRAGRCVARARGAEDPRHRRFKNGGVLFLLWDEGSSQGDDPPFIVISPNAKAGFVSQTDYDTSAFLQDDPGDPRDRGPPL